MNPYSTRALLGAIAGLTLAGCGSVMPTASPSATLVLAGVVQGPPDALTLGGRVLDLSAATITLNGEPAAPTTVAPGVVVAGTGTLSGPRVNVTHIEVRFRAKGAIDQVDPEAGFVDVLGLRARVTPATRIVREEPTGGETALTLADLSPGDFVTAFGPPIPNDPDGAILATRIEHHPEDQAEHPNRAELRLAIRDLDPLARTFTYGLGVYTAAFGHAERVRGPLANGGFVRARGQRTARWDPNDPFSRGEIQLERVRALETPTRTAGAAVELSGLVHALDAVHGTFRLLDFLVDFSQAEVKGVLTEGAFVEVEGTLADDGVTVHAREVEVEDEREAVELELEGPLTGFNSVARTFQVAGIPVETTAFTAYALEDQRIPADAFWGADRTGMAVKVKGAFRNGVLLAEEVELE
ncbi:DUF5666 domain-containing protein [Marinithermus hydrothermalis]|uniref:DUF5666 domain-containing protein n=1 Tax=Marinithermus hydrothermalis (strain DSM 14884 / JCM 11576 / T1) TaxID=869210 RepID=F2NL24_MARHT|nr:DUF5666 domain-containing protein [Marinithermus hydrothermalis]AEB11427.1 hypothetical protein Marky_0677 [Marinithermus hydrothermalis DSM 14884]